MKIFAAAVALVMVIGFLVVAVIDYLQTSWLSANAAMSSVGRADKDTRMGPYDSPYAAYRCWRSFWIK